MRSFFVSQCYKFFNQSLILKPIHYIEDAVQIACDLGSYWGTQNFELCQKIQKLVFPNGVKWDKENRRLLTDGGNEFFDLLFRLSDGYKSMGSKKRGQILRLVLYGSGGRTRTSDLRVMSPTSCQLLYPAMYRYMG